MKVEIKFRGLTERGIWVYGIPIISKNSDDIYILQDDEKYKIIPITLAQYTGIKDVKGLEIYGRDILLEKVWDESAPNGKYYERYLPIYYKDGAFWVDKGFKKDTNNSIQLNSWRNPYVVGNIDTNSELLNILY